ncbi:MAG: hypothetical protein JW995_03900 [Melioribacteraceae bacterium]|nr:hypothetical protein [Melioribacteraceae bacterium]
MRRTFLIITLLISFSSLKAQYFSLMQDEGLLAGGLGLTWIDGQPHYALHFRPEIALSNFGIGLDLNMEFNSGGELRTENFNEFSDYLSIIRYVRYGYKNDPVYVRLGALDYASLGHGSIMYMYNNSPAFDTRKVGLEFDIDFNTFGLETVYGNFGQAGVIGLRGYIRPLQMSSAADIPILGNLEVGATFATDFDKNAGVTAGGIDPVSGKFKATEDEGSIQAYGFDLGLPVFSGSVASLELYYDFAVLSSFGNGSSAGAILRLNGLGLVDIQTRFERRFNNDNYIPSYFNSLYEIERFSFDQSTGIVASKVQALKAAESIGNGYYGELLVRVLNTFDIIGSYQRLDDQPNSGILHLASDISPEGMPLVARAGYDKVGIDDEGDLFTLDDRSYMFTEIGYKPLPYLIVSMVYHWTFTPVRDNDDNILKYKPQKKIEPRVSFVYPLDFKN